MNKLIVKQQGLSLVELMISIALGLFIIAGALQAFIGSRQAANFSDELSFIQENSRFIFDEINTGVRQAGDLGCPSSAVRNANTAGSINIEYNSTVRLDSTAGDVWFTYFYRGIEGYTGAVADAGFLAGKSAKAASDVLVIHKLDPSSFSTITTHDVTTAPSAPVFTTASNHNFEVEDVLMAVNADCRISSLFLASAKTATTATHGASVVGDYNNCAVGLQGGSVSCAGATTAAPFFTQSLLSKVATTAYFVDDDNTLNRLVAGNDNATELVEGVERLILKFGVDNNSDGVANQYKTTSSISAAEWSNVVTIKLGLIMRSETAPLDVDGFITCEGQTSATDKVLRKCIRSTINIRNRGGQNI